MGVNIFFYGTNEILGISYPIFFYIYDVANGVPFHEIFKGHESTYSHCGSQGCVALGCFQEKTNEKKPKLIYVDTGSSQCFRLPTNFDNKFKLKKYIDEKLTDENKKRKNEILHIYMTDDSYKVVQPKQISIFLYGNVKSKSGGKSKKKFKKSGKRMKKTLTKSIQKNKTHIKGKVQKTVGFLNGTDY
jgi:hypothetical protein